VLAENRCHLWLSVWWFCGSGWFRLCTHVNPTKVDSCSPCFGTQSRLKDCLLAHSLTGVSVSPYRKIGRHCSWSQFVAESSEAAKSLLWLHNLSYKRWKNAGTSDISKSILSSRT